MKILFTPYSGGSIAHVIRCLAIADKLKERGHKILFTTTKVRKPFINQAGYEVFGEGHAEVNLNDEKDQSINKAVEAFQPDIVVNSPSFFGSLIRHKYGIPYVTILNAQWLSHFRGLLGLGKSKDDLSHLFLRKLLRPVFTKRFEALYLKEIQEFYRALDIGYIPSKRVELHMHNPILIPSIYEFEPLEPDTRDDVHFLGPLFWRGFEDMEFDKHKMFTNPDKPLIYHDSPFHRTERMERDYEHRPEFPEIRFSSRYRPFHSEGVRARPESRRASGGSDKHCKSRHGDAGLVAWQASGNHTS